MSLRLQCAMRPNFFQTPVFIALFAIFGNISPSHAQSQTKFAFPVECTLGEDCWTINYVDTESAEDAHKDFMCHAKTYEGHKGTDFALRSRVEMEAGVNVLAVADGQVLRIRDGESDSIKTEEQYQAIKAANRDCGNGVIIDHGNGLLSYYCHLKNGSIKVRPKQDVREGDVIAQIGQSGFSEFPHLHFTVIWEGGHIDPFTGHLMGEGCGAFKEPLWKDKIEYEPYSVFDGGFEDKIPDFKEIKKGRTHPQTLKTTADTLVYWAGFYHARKGDQLTLEIRDPEDNVFAQRDITLEKRRKRPSFYYTGRKLKGKTLKPGIYTGHLTYKREGQPEKTYAHKITVK